MYTNFFQNNKIFEAVKCFDWYRLSNDDFQVYYLFLNYVQQPRIIYIAGVLELNMKTCVSVSIRFKLNPTFLLEHQELERLMLDTFIIHFQMIKTIYSCAMVLSASSTPL